ncbi:MAG: alpha-L-arabinofuranosidase C-terminal domain-containing protein [Nanoarchaeota archaeon]
MISFFINYAYCDDAQITVYTDKKNQRINDRIFGNNLLGHEGIKSADFGYGVIDGKWKTLINAPLELAKEAKVTMFRYPGGCGTHTFDWKQAIGKKRIHFLFGIDEFLEVCDASNAQPIITVSYFTGDEADKADLIEYLNSPNDGTNPNGGVDWAKERAKNGHPKPYNVTYFEIGNEVYHGDHRNIKKVMPEEYAKRYLKYYSVMKLVDPSIQIGAILYTSEWNRRVMEIISDKIDFGIIHTYPSPGVDKETLERMDQNDIFSISLSVPVMSDEYSLKEVAKLLKEKASKNVPLAITEYNGGFVQEKPVPYRHCLGTALINAELLRIFSKPENNILLANYWQFNNSYWGMIANEFDGTYKTLYNPYFKRPNYYVFEMYHKHFGDILIDADVKCDTYDVSQYRTFKQRINDFIKKGIILGGNLLGGKWNIREFRGVKVIENEGILEINFVEPKEFNYYHSTKDAKVEPGTYYKLSGYIKAKNLNDLVGVCFEVQDSRGWDATKSAASTDKITGTSDWTYVEVIYRTLDDASGVTVIARRIGNSEPFEGKAYFKDVKFEKFIPELEMKIPYLSVNASKSADEKKVYLMVINKNMDALMTAAIDLKDFAPAAKGNAWVLNGPSVDATNEKMHDNVKVTHRTFEIRQSQVLGLKSQESAGTQFEFTFEPHSLTAIEIEGISYVDVKK